MDFDLQQLLKDTNAKLSDLDVKKEQTSKKIEYITKYVQEWIRVGCMSKNIKVLNFIDGMCNAGIYRDGEFGTAIKVYELFLEAASNYPNMRFNLVFNDLDETRVRVFKEVCKMLSSEHTLTKPLTNIKLHYSNNDINAFICDLPKHDSLLSKYGTLTLLFIDPYNARTVDVPILHGYIESHYCELFFNWFSSDHVRNPGDSTINSCFSGLAIPPGGDAAQFVAKYLAGENKSFFSYSFRNQKNAEIYQIIFITPNLKGLEKIKEALWQTFGGEEYHRNHQSASYQASIFSLDAGKDIRKELYGEEARQVLIDELVPGRYTYDQIAAFVLQRSMLRTSDIIQHVIKPLIVNGVIKKLNIAGARNFKKDSYEIRV